LQVEKAEKVLGMKSLMAEEGIREMKNRNTGSS
jgi:hypothetical protein